MPHGTTSKVHSTQQCQWNLYSKLFMLLLLWTKLGKLPTNFIKSTIFLMTLSANWLHFPRHLCPQNFKDLHHSNSTAWEQFHFWKPRILKLSCVKLLQDAENQHVRLCTPSSWWSNHIHLRRVLSFSNDIKAKQYLYRPGRTLRVPGSWSSQISKQSAY
jgi:hypothetical protein